MRVLANRPLVARHRFEDESGGPASPSVVTLAVTDGAAVAVAGVGAPAAESNATGVYTATIPARTQADTLTLTWTATIGGAAWIEVDHLEVVLSRLVNLRDLREHQTDLSTTERDRLARVAESVEDEIAGILPVTPFLRGKRSNVLAGGDTLALFPYGPIDRLYSLVTSTGTALTVADYDIDGWFLTYPNEATWPEDTYTAHYVYGERPGQDLRDAAASLARIRAQESIIPDRASVMNTASGTITFLTPNERFPTGYPSIDAVLIRYGAGLGMVMA